MARKPNPVGKTEAATYLRGKRLQTKATTGRYVGDWPVSQPDFVEWMNSHIKGEPISVGAYIAWENGTREPRPDALARIKAVLDVTPLPGA